MEQIKSKIKVYAFIDSQNLNLGTKKDIYKSKKLIYNGKYFLFYRNKIAPRTNGAMIGDRQD